MEPALKNLVLDLATATKVSFAYQNQAQPKQSAPLPNAMMKRHVPIMAPATMVSVRVATPMAPMVVETLVTQIPHASTVRSAMLLASANGILEAHQISALSALRTMIVAPGSA